MREQLALELLARVTNWTDEELREWVPELLRMSEYKYDDYEGFGPGERFLESLGRWLAQFDADPNAQRRLSRFVREEMVFVSRHELNHAIACAYPDIIKPRLMSWVAVDEGVDRFRVNEIAAMPAFRALRRRTLYLGLSDGARLDRLRRSSPELSHEQFWLSPEIGDVTRQSMIRKLAKALEAQELAYEPTFQHVVLVDDFYGSGTSLLDEEDGGWDGKLKKASDHLEVLAGLSPSALDADARVAVVLYVASARAEAHVRDCLDRFHPNWTLDVVQRLPASIVVVEPELVALCESFFDPVLIDEHKGAAPLGYKGTSLPVVLHHNTPNNSISVLWADSTDRDDGQHRHALFPRYERHHVDRP